MSIKHAEMLVERILALIPNQPQILTCTDVWELFDVPGYSCDGLELTMGQASWALARAQTLYRQKTGASQVG